MEKKKLNVLATAVLVAAAAQVSTHGDQTFNCPGQCTGDRISHFHFLNGRLGLDLGRGIGNH